MFRGISNHISAPMMVDGKVADVAEPLPLAQLIQRALEAHKNGQLDEAISAYENVLPGLTGKLASTLHSNVGAIYMSKGENDLAREHFSSAVAAEPDNPQSHFNLAVILTSKFDAHGKAIGHCGTALKLDPTMFKALHLMGNILQNLGKDAEAQKYFVMAENLAQELSDQAAGVVPGQKEGLAIDGQTGWDRFAIMSAHVGDEFSIKSSSYKETGLAEEEEVTYNLICLSERPLVFRIPNFMTVTEGQHIVRRAASQLQKSFVMGGAAGDSSVEIESSGISKEDVVDGENPQLYRSSYNAWLHPDELATRLQRRLADLTGFPLQLFQHKSEELQVVKYDIGGQFKVHHDSSTFHPRLLTALLYLNSVPDNMGGETWFPFAGKRRSFDLSIEEAISAALQMRTSNPSAISSDHKNSATTEQNGLLCKPVCGDAIIFFNHLPSGAIDSAAVHAGLPMMKAFVDENEGNKKKDGEVYEKWIANYWVEQDFIVLFAES